MQTITMHLRAASVKGTLVDEWNQQVNSLPALTRGLRAELVLKLVDTNGNALEGLDAYGSWDFAIADDWDTTTKPQIRVVEGITVTDNEVHIPLTETNTEELIAALGNNESATFGCELAGFDTGETQPGFLLQFDISIRNRRCDAGTGTPAPVTDANYSAAQVDALFASKFSVEISVDLESWGKIPPGTTEITDARWFHIRNAEVGRDWSDPIPLIVGPRGERSTIQVGNVEAGGPGTAPVITNTGDEHDAVFDFTIPQGEKGDTATVSVGTVELVEATEDAEVYNSGDEHDAVLDFKIPRGLTGEDGESAYLYVAYATDSKGGGFSLTPASTRKYRAELHTTAPIAHPSSSDFAGATWVKYLGDDETVYGDVLVADADTSVDKVSRIVFENATIRKGIDGEVIVHFKEAGVTVDEMNRYATINGRTRLSAWTNGGGSVSAMPGLTVCEPNGLEALAAFPQYSSFIG